MNVERQSPSKHASTAADATLQLLQGTVELFPLLIQDIDAAQHTVQLETYIFDTKGSGAEVAQALERAALRGVKVRLVVDGYGTPEWPVEWAQRFQSAGVQTLVFEPIVTFGFLFPANGEGCIASWLLLIATWATVAASISWMTFMTPIMVF